MKPLPKFLPLAAILLLISSPFANAQDKTPPAGEPIDNSINVSALKYDILVDGNLPADDPAHNQYKTLQAAYAAAQPGTETKPTVIGIKPNVYLIQGTDDPQPSLAITKDWITLLGLTNNRRAVVIADNRGLDEGASDDGYLLDVKATGFTAKNLTILNYCNCDYEYPGDPTKNLQMRNPTITQAVALQAAGDKHVYQNVAILSRLDTMFLRTTRSYFKNCYIEGTDDWMGGGQMSVWQDCDLVYPTGHGVMSATNCVFFNCNFQATRGMEFYKSEFGSAARPDTLINCTLPVSTPQSRVAWVRGTAVPRPNKVSLTYKNKDTAGNPVVIYDDTESPPAFTYSRELSDKELLAYNPWNLLRAAANQSPDDWDPAGLKKKYPSASYDNPVYRIALKIGDDDTTDATARAAGIDTGISPARFATIRTGGEGVAITATPLPADTDDSSISWSTPSKLVALSQPEGRYVVVTGQNTTDLPQYVPIQATASNGFYVTAYVFVQPKFINPPKLTIAPSIQSPTSGKVHIVYALALAGRTDHSLITWYTCDDAAGTNPQKIAVSRGDQPLTDYTLLPGDVGKYLRASIEPKFAISDPGPAVFAIAKIPIAAADVPSPNVSPNFQNFVESPTATPTSGNWLIQGVWTIVPRPDLTNGFGIRAGTGKRGSRGEGSFLYYYNSSPATDMQIDLVITPDKTEGTVFAVPGSPDDTGTRNSYGDIFIKYDPLTKTGYSLRYWRTTQSAAACTYQFYKIDNGVGAPLNDTQIQSGVFKRNTLLTLKVTGNTLSVQAHNTTDNQTLSMQATIDPNTNASAGIAATGCANIYSQFKVSYP
jgi:pectinesterase